MKDYVISALLLNMEHHYHQDLMNAAANDASPKFRPITVETAEACKAYLSVGLIDSAAIVLEWANK